MIALTAHDKLQLVAALVGAVSFMFAGLRWRNLRYSAGAFFAVPAAALAAWNKEWDVVAIFVATAILTILIDVVCYARERKKA